MRIVIESGSCRVTATLRDTPTAHAVHDALPIEGTLNFWGDEVYFRIGLAGKPQLEPDARDVVESGEIAYWIEGDAIAIGYGPTPVSSGDEIRLVAPVNIFADADGDVSQFRHCNPGASVTVSMA